MKLDFTKLADLRTRAAALAKTSIQPHVQRIDALQWRERLILFLLLATVIGVVLHMLVISPLQAERRAQLREQALQSTTLKILRLQLTQALLLSQADSAPGQLLQGLRRQQGEQAQLAQQIASAAAVTTQHSNVQAELPNLLAELLRQQAGLTLVRLSTISDAPKFAGTAALDGWQWQGVELHVAGDYLALLRYLRQLETDLPGLRWGEMKLSAAKAGPTLTPSSRTGVGMGMATTTATATGTGSTALLKLQVFLLKAKS